MSFYQKQAAELQRQIEDEKNQQLKERSDKITATASSPLEATNLDARLKIEMDRLTNPVQLAKDCQIFFKVLEKICEPNEKESAKAVMQQIEDLGDEHLLQFVYFFEQNKLRFKYIHATRMKEVTEKTEIFKILANSKTIFLSFLLKSDSAPTQSHAFFVFNPQESSLCMHFQAVANSKDKYVALLAIPEEDYLEYFFSQTMTSAQPHLEIRYQSFVTIFEKYVKNFFPKDKPPVCIEALPGDVPTMPIFPPENLMMIRQALRWRNFFRFCTQLKRIPKYTTKSLFSANASNLGEWRKQATGRVCEEMYGRVKIVSSSIQNHLVTFTEEINTRIIVPLGKKGDNQQLYLEIVTLRDFTKENLDKIIINVEFLVKNTLNFAERLNLFGEFIFKQFGYTSQDYKDSKITAENNFKDLEVVVPAIRELLGKILDNFTTTLQNLISKQDKTSLEFIHYSKGFLPIAEITKTIQDLFSTQITVIVEDFFKFCITEIEKRTANEGSVDAKAIQSAFDEATKYLAFISKKILPAIPTSNLKMNMSTNPASGKQDKMVFKKTIVALAPKESFVSKFFNHILPSAKFSTHKQESAVCFTQDLQMVNDPNKAMKLSLIDYSQPEKSFKSLLKRLKDQNIGGRMSLVVIVLRVKHLRSSLGFGAKTPALLRSPPTAADCEKYLKSVGLFETMRNLQTLFLKDQHFFRENLSVALLYEKDYLDQSNFLFLNQEFRVQNENMIHMVLGNFGSKPKVFHVPKTKTGSLWIQFQTDMFQHMFSKVDTVLTRIPDEIKP